MVMSKHVPINTITVNATDLDAVVLAKAKIGVYDKKEIAGVPADFKTKYFTQEDDKFRISDE
jgi:chemotaxis protein methyltransferase CheR